MDGKIAAIWCRVSTHGQRELSLDSQELAVRRALEARGYLVPPDYVFKIEWTSLDLMACPEFQTLRQWISQDKVQAIGTLDRDRFQAQGLQRLLFLSECQERGVQVIVAQGPALLEGAEGQLVELALALGKERSVLRAQQGAKAGLRDRTLLKGLPPVPRAPLGYRWQDGRLTPTDDWPLVEHIFRRFLEGASLRQICGELVAMGRLTQRGRAMWHPHSVWYILTNPVYAGRYHALRHEAQLPKERRGPTFGKSSRRLRPREEWVYLSGITVERPIVPWEAFQEVQRRLDENRSLGRRTARQDFLLRSLVFCQLCGARYQAKVSTKESSYMCGRRRRKVPGMLLCFNRQLHKERLETRVWEALQRFLEDPETVNAEMQRREKAGAESGTVLEKALQDATRRLNRNSNAEAELVGLRIRTDNEGAPLITEEAFQRQSSLLRSERRWLEEECQRLAERMGRLVTQQATLEHLQMVRRRVAERLHSCGAAERRWVLECLQTRVLVWPDRVLVDIAVDIPVGEVSNTPGGSGDVPPSKSKSRRDTLNPLEGV